MYLKIENKIKIRKIENKTKNKKYKKGTKTFFIL